MIALRRFLTSVAPLLATAAPSAATETPAWHPDIAPLLRQYCAGCHNDVDYEGDFTVERFADFLEGGSKGNPVEDAGPDTADATLLMRQLTGEARKPMPPPDEPQPSDDEVALFHAWVAAGAPGPEDDADVSILQSLEVPSLPAAPGAKPVTALAASPDGRHVAVARSRTVEVTEVATGVPAFRSDELPGKVNSVGFSPGGELVLAASGVAGLEGVAFAWDLATGDEVRSFGRGYHRDVLYDAVLSPDGKTVATAGYDHRIALWDLGTGELLRSIEVHNGAVFDLAFSPDGTVLASASADQTVKLWQVESGVRLDTLNQPEAEQFAVAFTPDGHHILAAGADRRVRMWRFVSKEKPALNPLVHARFAHDGPVSALAVSPDGSGLATAGGDRTLKFWSLPDLTLTGSHPDQPDFAAALAFAGESVLTVARLDGSTAAFAAPAHAPGGPPPDSGGGPVPAANSATFAATTIEGVVTSPRAPGLHRFRAEKAQQVVLEVNAARSGSPLDSKIEVLDAEGRPVPQVLLQEVRQTWLTFRGKDSTDSNDFRLHNWEDMELNEFLYVNGEVVKLWLYPRGPDSGFIVYPGFGNRQNYFATTALSHPLGQPAAIVRPFPPGATPPPNGLPVHTVYYENDDDPSRRLGTDSHLIFTAPEGGDYLARVSDARGFGGEDYRYRLDLRPPAPGFTARVSGLQDPGVSPGSGKEFTVEIDRVDGFDGEVRFDVTGLPPGFAATTPVVIEAGQRQATGTLSASPDAPAPAEGEAGTAALAASAETGGATVTRDAGSFGTITLADTPKVRVAIKPHENSGAAQTRDDGTLVLTIHPGETIYAKVEAERLDFDGRIEFGTEDAGRNLPHGVIVANIGLNGLMIPEGQTAQTFALTAAPWVAPTERLFHVRAKNAGGETTPPVLLRVARHPDLAER